MASSAESSIVSGWQHNAPCSGLGDLFYGGPRRERREDEIIREAQARAICAECPHSGPLGVCVTQETAEQGTATSVVFGFRGGLTAGERRKLIGAANTKRLRPLVAECGTYSGWQRHRRMREAICEPCSVARTAYTSAYGQSRRAG